MTPLHLLPCVCFHTDKQHVCSSSKHKHIWAATREQQQQTPGVPLQPARADRWFSSLIASISLYRANKQLRQPHPRWRTYNFFIYTSLHDRWVSWLLGVTPPPRRQDTCCAPAPVRDFHYRRRPRQILVLGKMSHFLGRVNLSPCLCPSLRLSVCMSQSCQIVFAVVFCTHMTH